MKIWEGYVLLPNLRQESSNDMRTDRTTTTRFLPSPLHHHCIDIFVSISQLFCELYDLSTTTTTTPWRMSVLFPRLKECVCLEKGLAKYTRYQEFVGDRKIGKFTSFKRESGNNVVFNVLIYRELRKKSKSLRSEL